MSKMMVSIPLLASVILANRAKKAKRKAKAKRLKIRKPSLAKLKTRLWALLSPAIKDRYGSTCYSCHAQGLSGSNLHGGHMFSAGLHSLTRFDARNIRPQCLRCNVALRSNAAMFAARYIDREGKDAFDAMAAASRVSKKWTRPEIEVLIDKIREGIDHYQGFYETAYGLQSNNEPRP